MISDGAGAADPLARVNRQWRPRAMRYPGRAIRPETRRWVEGRRKNGEGIAPAFYAHASRIGDGSRGEVGDAVIQQRRWPAEVKRASAGDVVGLQGAAVQQICAAAGDGK